ncbi:MAG: hypothetical protein NTX45_01785 [Proteobacteria bacterium]|nr:hypothetical protein [Pseudomonadota bacterium]
MTDVTHGASKLALTACRRQAGSKGKASSSVGMQTVWEPQAPAWVCSLGFRRPHAQAGAWGSQADYLLLEILRLTVGSGIIPVSPRH